MATIDDVGVIGLTKVAEQNLVFGLLVAFIVFGSGFAFWIINNLLKELKDSRIKYAADMETVRKEYSQDSKDLVKVMTEVNTTLRLAINK